MTPDSQAIRSIKPSDLPAPPQSAIEIMRACAQSDIDNKTLANLVASDPLLAAELLRIANSAFYGFVSKVNSVARAISLLGLRALRNLALCISVRGALKNDAIPGFDITAYWEEALRHAICARLIAEKTGMDADECFTAGLLMEFGMLVLFYLNPDKAHLLTELYELDPDSRQILENETFGTSHDHVTMLLAETWSLPEDLTQALNRNISAAGNESSSQESKLHFVLTCADWMAAVFSSTDKVDVLKRINTLLSHHFNLTDEEVEECLKVVPEQIEEAALALGLHIKQQVDFDTILSSANVQIIESNLSYQELSWRLEKTLKERDQLAAELDQELKLAREMQQTLLPPIREPSFPVTGVNISARYLSGDFYDYFTLENGCIYFNLGDVSGKGTNAAIMMAKVSSLFHCIGKQIHEPARLMETINNEISETSVRGMFITMAAGLYDPKTGTLRLVNAGHPPLLVYQNKTLLQTLDAQAPPIGVLPDIAFPEIELNLRGKSLYIYSDGITEGRLANGKELGVEGLMQMITDYSDEPPQDRLTAIVNHFDTPTPLRDDVTLLLLEDNHGQL